MYLDLFTLKVENFRAIKEATIGLNGITVVAGINGCGKSTLSKLLFHTLYTAQNLEKLITSNMLVNLQWFDNVMDYLNYRVVKKNVDDEGNQPPGYPPFRKERIISRLHHGSSLNGIKENYDRCFEEARTFLPLLVENRESIIRYIYEKIPGRESIALENKTLESIVETAIGIARAIIDYGESLLKKRDNEFFKISLEETFGETVPVENYHFWELDNEVTDYSAGCLAPIFSIEKIAYLDTPFILDWSSVEKKDIPEMHWMQMAQLFKKPSLPKYQDDDILKMIEQDVLGGKIQRNQNPPQPFTFIQDDNEYDLKQCATGVKSIAIIHHLLTSGFLDDTSMLIIDEPEAHLHPAWIVEYARLIVLLHKKHRVKFFIATHSPDMVSALKYIGEKEMADAEKRMGFYLAEEDEQEKHQFVFRSLGMNIGPIHGSFNIAIDKTDEYGDLEREPVF